MSNASNNPITWLDRHGTRIQTIAVIVQAIVALLMVATLWESEKGMQIMKRQFESTLEPTVDMTYGKPGDRNFNETSFTTWKQNVGGVIINAAYSTNLFKGFTNLTVVTIKNVGAVSISDLEVAGWVLASFDSLYKITNAIPSTAAKLVEENLSTGRSTVYDFGKEPAIQGLLHLANEKGGSHACCFILRFRNSIDRKPRFKLLTFVAINLSADKKELVAVPIDNTFGAMFDIRNGEVPVDWKMKAEIREFLKRMDFPILAN